MSCCNCDSTPSSEGVGALATILAEGIARGEGEEGISAEGEARGEREEEEGEEEKRTFVRSGSTSVKYQEEEFVREEEKKLNRLFPFEYIRI